MNGLIDEYYAAKVAEYMRSLDGPGAVRKEALLTELAQGERMKPVRRLTAWHRVRARIGAMALRTTLRPVAHFTRRA